MKGLFFHRSDGETYGYDELSFAFTSEKLGTNEFINKIKSICPYIKACELDSLIYDDEHITTLDDCSYEVTIFIKDVDVL